MNKTKEEILQPHISTYQSDNGESDFDFIWPENASKAMDEYTTHLTDQIKSMEGQVKELREREKYLQGLCDIEQGRHIETTTQLESLQKEAIDFAEWMLTESVKKYGDDKWEIRKYFNLSMTNGNSAYYTSKELYEQFKSTPSQINN